MTKPLSVKEPRSYADAMVVLDQRRNGADMPVWYVMRALELTGDHEPASRYRPQEYRRLFELERA